MSRPEAKWTSTAGSTTIFGQREMLSGESRLSLIHGEAAYTHQPNCRRPSAVRHIPLTENPAIILRRSRNMDCRKDPFT
jgi:hypothetical protein